MEAAGLAFTAINKIVVEKRKIRNQRISVNRLQISMSCYLSCYEPVHTNCVCLGLGKSNPIVVRFHFCSDSCSFSFLLCVFSVVVWPCARAAKNVGGHRPCFL